MYEYIRGKLIEATPSYAVVDVQGVGYKILIPLRNFGQLPSSGEGVFFFTSWVVREVSQTLFGFLTKEERNVFEILITLSGIGPKTALGIIGHLELADLARAVQTNNILAFSKVPGVGKKTGERLIVDLKGKLDFSSLPGPIQRAASSQLQDALHALMNLGYTPTLAEKAVEQAAAELEEGYDLSTLISRALKLQKNSPTR